MSDSEPPVLDLVRSIDAVVRRASWPTVAIAFAWSPVVPLYQGILEQGIWHFWLAVALPLGGVLVYGVLRRLITVVEHNQQELRRMADEKRDRIRIESEKVGLLDRRDS